jgi:hypothetical protein
MVPFTLPPVKDEGRDWYLSPKLPLDIREYRVIIPKLSLNANGGVNDYFEIAPGGGGRILFLRI